MMISELLDQIRGYYLERFQAAVDERANDPGTQIITESPFLDQSGAPARTGALDLPLRGDLFVVQDGQVVESRQIDTEGMLGFEPIHFTWGAELEIELCPFQWNFCSVVLSPSPDTPGLRPMLDWFERWFECSDRDAPRFEGVVHYLSDPEFASDGCRLDIDFGSAPVEAFEEFLEACAQVGATELRVGDAVPSADEADRA